MENQGYPEQRYVVTALLRYILAAILFVVLVAFFAWFFFFRSTDSGDTDTPTNTGQSSQSTDKTTKKSDESNAKTNEDKTTSDDASTGTGKIDAEGNSATSDERESTPTPTNELANTGPGDVIALFAIVTIAAATLKRHQLSRR